MKTLLLRFAAPLQAWGDESKYDIRGTRNEPTKSGVIGMIAAAMGLRRDNEEIAEMSAKLRMGIRVDQPGTVLCDFHTALSPDYSANGDLRYDNTGKLIREKNPFVTKRYYLCDARFLVGLECEDDAYLQNIAEAVTTPVFPLFLGRRSCPPSLPVLLGTVEGDLEAALRGTEWIAADWFKNQQGSIRASMIIETKRGQEAWHTQMDQPVSYSPIHRRYTLRGLDKEQYVFLGRPEHDPMKEL